VVRDQRNRFAQTTEVGVDLRAVGRVAFHDCELCVIQCTGFGQDAARDGDLPDVVE
jgi:hypothetical protein